MRCAEMVRGASLRGASNALGFDAALRLGRALGTTRRRQGRAGAVLVGRTAGTDEARVRDGLAAGLVLAGIAVVDVGVVESDRLTAALRARHERGPAPEAGAYVSLAGDTIGIMLFEGGRPVVGPPLAHVARVADEGAFADASGTGSVVMIDARLVPRDQLEDEVNDGGGDATTSGDAIASEA